MSVTPTVLFGRTQHEIASLIEQELKKCLHAKIVSGFITVEGMKVVEGSIRSDPTKIETVIAGAGTYRAYEAFDALVTAGVPLDRLFVHLGHTRRTGSSARHRFYRYHPMLHSKIFYMEHPDETVSAIVGSHNVTGFALTGMNGEAAVLLQGPNADPEFDKIRSHIDQATTQAVPYSPGMKEAFSWWTTQFAEGLRDKTNDAPREGEAKKTILILTESDGSGLPKADDTIYFELPEALQIQSLQAEVHIYVFDRLPSDPWTGLQTLDTARASYWCRTTGLELEQGGRELEADWEVSNHYAPRLSRTVPPFRPSPPVGMEQVRVLVRNEVWGKFEYLFETRKKKWLPEFGKGEEWSLQVDDRFRDDFAALSLMPNPEHLEWHLVTGLIPDEAEPMTPSKKALLELSPERGSFIMVSLRRREKAQTDDEEQKRRR